MSVKVFDRKKRMLREAADSVDAMKQELEGFFNGLSRTPRLPAHVGAGLQAFTFEFTFIDRDSTQDERNRFGMMDFPVYLESTIGSDAFTDDESAALLVAHKIPETTVVMRIVSDEEGVSTPEELKPYVQVGEFVPKQTSFGVGVPGAYSERGNQSKCRKIGTLAVNKLIENVPSPVTRQQRFIFVLKHEIGHMLSLAHQLGTIMDTDYEEVVKHPTFTLGQVLLIHGALFEISNL